MKLIIIQPWFTAIGHPAQSLINMASAIGRDESVDYLVSSNGESGFFLESMEQLRAWGKVGSYVATTPTGDSNTVRALLATWRMRLKGCKYQRIFFFDESLYVLALLWPLCSLFLPVERLGVLHLFGPNLGKGPRNRWARFVIARFLRRPEVRLYLRTEELATAWRDAFNTVESGQIRYLPSLEIPEDELRQYPKRHSDTLAFGIIGQIRIGKAIEWLVPAFQNNAALGKLTVAGEFANPQNREQLSLLSEFDGFINCFMSESEMLERAAGQDYLLMLYDLWDKRMESAVLYLAARVNRPVIVYGDSWCGRMVREFGCGVVAPVDQKEAVDLLLRIPRPGSAEYAQLLKGMDTFRQAYSVNSLRGKVIQELLG
ncbi:MAG: hypothetical protein Q7T29_00155 [Gallionella sp.]|nr:hypothetical protein [Gallionella sp.]